MNGPVENLMHSETTILFDYIYININGSAIFSRWKREFFKRETCAYLFQARVTVLLDYNACFTNNLRMVIEQRESIYEYRILCKSSGNYVDVERR